MNTNENIINDARKRAELVQRTEVLEKVGNLVLLPNHDGMTTDQVASYFEVDVEVVKKLRTRHKAELELDGYYVYQGQALKDMKSLSGYDGRAPRVSFFPRRAILRVGMLLRDSLVAKTIRDYLLDAEQVAVASVVNYDLHELKREVFELKAQRDQLMALIGEYFIPQRSEDGRWILAPKEAPAISASVKVDLDEIQQYREAKSLKYPQSPVVMRVAVEALRDAGYKVNREMLFKKLIEFGWVRDFKHGNYASTAEGRDSGVSDYTYMSDKGFRGHTVMLNADALEVLARSF